MTNITTGSVLSANVRVNNYTDENKKYDIVADVSVVSNPNEYGDGQIQNGSVSLNGSTLATWSYYNNLAINFQTSDEEQQSDILTEVQKFAEAVLGFKSSAVLTAITPTTSNI